MSELMGCCCFWTRIVGASAGMPYCGQPVLTAENGTDEYKQHIHYLRIGRIAWFAGFVCIYFTTLQCLAVPRQIMSGVRSNLIDEMFPSPSKVAERVKRGIAAGYSAGETIQAEDVSELLLAVTSFCKNQEGTNIAISSEWICRMGQVELGESKVSQWDPVDNAPLEQKSTPIAFYKRRLSSLRNICSRPFLDQHVSFGDNPNPESGPPVDFFNMAQFTAAFMNNSKIEGLSSDFDSAAGFSLDVMAQRVKELQASNANMGRTIETLDKKMDALLSQLGAGTLPPHHDIALRSNSHQRVLGVNLDGIADVKPSPKYSQGCFTTRDLPGVLRQKWYEFDQDHNDNLDAEEAKALFANLFPKNAADLTHLLGSGVISVNTYIDYAKAHLVDMNIPRTSFMAYKCRNHHFGLLSLCKPSFIRARYQILHVSRYDNSMSVLARLALTLDFTALAASELAPNSGFYDSNFVIDTTLGMQATLGVLDMVAMALTLALAFFLFVMDAAITIVMWPVSIVSICRLRFVGDESVTDMARTLKSRLLMPLDYRGVKCQFVLPVFLVGELFLGIVFVSAMVNSVHYALQPGFFLHERPMGTMSDECMKAYIESDRAWIKGQGGDHGVSQFEYMTKCIPWTSNRIMRIVHIVNLLLFQTHEATFGHGAICAFSALRCFEVLDVVPMWRWVLMTVRLSGLKLINFLSVYALLIITFGGSMYIQFGDLYNQFSTLSDAVTTMAQASIGNTNRATDHLKPFHEWSGTAIYAYLMIFQVLIVTIAMNVFTTIIIGGFTLATDNTTAAETARALELENVKHMATYFGWQDKTAIDGQPDGQPLTDDRADAIPTDKSELASND